MVGKTDDKKIYYTSDYEKSDWLRAFNQFTIACELDEILTMLNPCVYQ